MPMRFDAAPEVKNEINYKMCCIPVGQKAPIVYISEQFLFFKPDYTLTSFIPK